MALAATGQFAACAGPSEPFRAVSERPARVTWHGAGARGAADGALRLDGGGGAELLLDATPARMVRLLPDGQVLFFEPPRRLRWQGKRSSVPVELAPWADLLSLAATPKLPDGRREIHGAGRRVAVEVREGVLRAASVAGEAGTSVAAVFAGRENPLAPAGSAR